MRKIGYIRVSSTNQNPSRQFQQLNEIGMDIIYEEKVSGATKDREQLQKVLDDYLLSVNDDNGDTMIIFTEDCAYLNGGSWEVVDE